MLKMTTDKHEASRGLSATAELLVSQNTGMNTSLSGVLMQNKMSITAMWMKSKQQGADYSNMVKIRTGS